MRNINEILSDTYTIHSLSNGAIKELSGALLMEVGIYSLADCGDKTFKALAMMKSRLSNKSVRKTTVTLDGKKFNIVKGW